MSTRASKCPEFHSAEMAAIGSHPRSKYAERLGPKATVVTIMVDSGLRYLSTDMYRE
ncbi:MAG: hypothetical protein ABSA92_12400 [Candidatus Bathyarchaeia archaeon]